MMRCRFVAVLALVVACATLGAGPAPAQQAEQVALTGRRPRFIEASDPSGREVDLSKAQVLLRRVSLDLTDVTVDSALKMITQQAQLRISYSEALLPAAKRVTMRAQDLAVAAALTEILLGTGLDVAVARNGRLAIVAANDPGRARQVAAGAIVGRVTDKKTQAALPGATVVVEGTPKSATTGNDGRYRIAEVAPGTYTVRVRYIGYAPGTASVTVSEGQEATADFSLEKSAQRLDEVVTTGTVVPTEVKALPTPISVVTAEDLEQQNFQRVDQVFRGLVPGAIAWDRGAGDIFKTVSVRGASALAGFPSIKTFVDGIEVADPLYSMIDATSVDRIEITRGPQASTLYGAGALDGVMQIFTKKGQFGLSRPAVTAKISGGAIGGFDGQSSEFQTDNTASVFGGSEKASYRLGGSYRHMGDWVPAYHENDWAVATGGRTLQGPFTISGSAQYSDKTQDSPWDTRLRAFQFFSTPPSQTRHIRYQSYGVTAELQTTQHWTHTLTVGYDNTSDDYHQTGPRLTTPADTLLYVITSHESKASLVYHTDLIFRLGTAARATVTAGLNRDWYELVFAGNFNTTITTGSLDGFAANYETPWVNTGYFSQMQVNLADRLFLTAGVRAERNPNFGENFGTAWSPRVGASYVVGLGHATVKFRASYGESIRAPDPSYRLGAQFPSEIILANPNLGPERQRGSDGGVEIYLGRASLAATYYNQRALDLIQSIVIVTPPGSLPTRQYQNISRVKNEGWEFEGRLPLGPVQVTGTYSIAHSTVQALPPGYTGDFQVGDRLLGVPYSSAGATIAYSPIPRTTLTATMTHFGHWINADYVALDGFYYGGQPYRGSGRAYWIEYPTVTKLSVGVSQVLSPNVTAFARADNVGNNLRPEESNASLPMPRSVTVGANLRY